MDTNRWVKASERMPDKSGRYVVKRLGELMIADAILRKNDTMVFAIPNGMTWNGYKEFLWLDESPESPSQLNELEELRKENERLKANVASLKQLFEMATNKGASAENRVKELEALLLDVTELKGIQPASNFYQLPFELMNKLKAIRR